MVVAILATAVHAGGQNPDGFNTPGGYNIVRSETTDYGVSLARVVFQCLEKNAWVTCTPKLGPYSDAGVPKLEGRIEQVSYKAEKAGSSGILLFRNYERVISEMGGQLVARMFGHNERSGKLRFLFLIPGAQKKWVLFETWGLSDGEMNLTVITSADVPNVLTAGELKSQLDTAGFATLNINFDTNKTLVRDEDKPALDQVRDLLVSSPSLRLSVDGHTDNVGGTAANKQLSQGRANAIVEYLKRSGIEASRLKPQGFGAEAPIADNRTEEGRGKNRRVELVKLP
ncbi:OmpA family protein [Hydrogenophaga sp. PAMC20947]|uniref:OmpA family protein n=1 Tax=Hydrogenophaga sp. PAMC20947 TaxID=2565558 RepID=UPI001445E2D5|nr:OmpA family protein [Hydrogenophaga sp. PAMC20947]